MSVSSTCNKVFKIAIDDYHKVNSVDAQNKNPFKDPSSLEKIIYDKCWIDTVQWHLEDIIRKPNIEPRKALKIKRRIDSSNQDRTDMVEELDDYFFKKFSNKKLEKNTISYVDWIELIKFKETRNYVQRVLENYNVYRYILEQKPVTMKNFFKDEPLY